MTKSVRPSDKFLGWSPVGAARARASDEQKQQEQREPLLPDRIDTVAMGEKKLTIRRANGETAQISVDNAMLESLIQRALFKQDLASIKELYRRLDAEEQSTLVKPRRQLTPQEREETRAIARDIFRTFANKREQLIALGVATMDGNKLKPDPAFLAQFRLE